MERLQKVIASAGITSRRKAEELISQGKVSVNGTIVKEMGKQVGPEDVIVVNGKEIRKEEKVYFLLNKPKKTISAVSDDKGRATVMDCFADINERIFPIGRLDYETTGLLLMTNDGEFANAMMHPHSHIEKTYECSIDGVLDDMMCAKLEKGIHLEDGKTLPARIEILQRSEKKNKTVFLITIQEGRNREIRRMMEYFHCEVTRLNRVKYAFLDLGKLRQGQYRKLRTYEVKKLMNCANQASSSMPKR